VRTYGAERIFCDSACDWGVSDPLAVPKTAELMRRSGISEELIEKVTYGNPLAAYGKSGQIKEDDWLNPAPIDQRTLYMGNSVLRGGQTPKVGPAPASGSAALGDLKIV
jgi:uncharacterized protein